MRDIKFRQPILDLEGDLIYFHYWGFIDGAFIGPETSAATIKEASQLSQRFTMMSDREETEIYEGDILLVHNFYFDGGCEAEREVKGVVIFDSFGFELQNIHGWVAEYMGYNDGDEESHVRIANLIPERFMDVNDAGNAELLEMWGHHEESYLVIGNTHQNPELK